MKLNSIEVIGKRKSSIAKIILFLPKDGGGEILINGEKAFNYLQNNLRTLKVVCSPFELLNINNYKVHAYVKGGGLSGQADAIKLAISKSLSVFIEKEDKKKLKVNGFLTRNSLCKERRKYGLKKARKAPQFSKR
uniref:Small ribosomal subunit protein uS9c n=2 Tax=Euglena gracilis TaxID=3039 RepID=RR9_EUGGR|nr:ribosomal protein S9 [Euglena gracilis]P32060.1 RecName: Full=Small ribosomal subunit protein uS9c; AltName: Full=30S ribosomal protein S9, chloroplastic [Euglena gracilis]AKL82388.1 ribosomal protein S9 [Euglena gracilis var. bacillaris]CAA50120.1 30S ribosomal protein S9 [Euglena gracilis]